MKPLTEIKNHKIAYDGSDGQLIIPFNHKALMELVPWYSKDEGIPWLKNRLQGGEGFAYVFKPRNDKTYIVQDLNTKIPTLYSGKYSVWGAEANHLVSASVFSQYPELSKILKFKFTLKDRIKYDMPISEQEMEEWGNKNQFSKVVEKVITADSPQKKEKAIENLALNFLGDYVTEHGGWGRAHPENQEEEISFEEEGFTLYSSMELYKEEYMGVSIDDDWALDIVLYDSDECEEQDSEELTYIDNYLTPHTLQNFVDLVKKYEPEYLTAGDNNIYVAPNVRWEEGTIVEFFDEYFESSWERDNWEVLEALGCAIGSGRKRELSKYIDEEITYPFEFEYDYFTTTFTYPQLLQIIGNTGINNFSELRERDLNEIACCVNDIWYDSWDIDDEGHKEINDRMNSIINTIREEYKDNYTEIKNNILDFKSIMKDLDFVSRGYGWGGPQFVLEKGSATEDQPKHNEINIKIRKFDPKTNTVELIDYLKDAQGIPMSVEEIVPYVTNLKIPFDKVEDNPTDNQ
mgnify:CR=1 FL=1